MGYAFDPSIQGMRSISGFPGASLLGSPVELGTAAASAAISPRQDFAVFAAADDGAVRVVFLPDLEMRPLAAAASSPSRIVFSADGWAVGLFQQERPRVQIFTHMPQEPVLAREISLAGVSGDVVSAAISDDGELALFLTGRTGNAAAWISLGGSDPVPLGLPAATAAMALRSGSRQAVIVTQDGQVGLLNDVAAGTEMRVLWSGDERTADPVAVRFSADGASVYVATRGGTIAALGIETEEASFVSCGCNPSGLFPLRSGTLFRLNDISDGPLLLLDVAGAHLRTWFVPALERSAR